MEKKNGKKKGMMGICGEMMKCMEEALKENRKSMKKMNTGGKK